MEFMKALPILLSLALSIISCRTLEWNVETYTYDNIAREIKPNSEPVPVYYLKNDITFRYKIIGRANATCSVEQRYDQPIPLKLLKDQVREVGGDALLAPKLEDSYTWTAPIIERID
mgnify:FL=1